MSPARESRHAANEFAVVGILALIPLAVLAWPFTHSFVGTALEPELVGAAAVALLALPAIGFVALTRQAPRVVALVPLFVYVVACFGSLYLAPPTDTLEAERALLVLCAGVALALVGASARRGARDLFVATLPWLSLVLLGAAFVDREHAYRGVLQNTGATSEAALAGALVGAWSFVRAKGFVRFVGLAAVIAFAAYVRLAPVLAGLAAFVATLAVAAFVQPENRRKLAAILAVALFTFGAARTFGVPTASSDAAATTSSNDFGGVSVRLHLWKVLPRFVADHGALGAGPGQFRATFPPYRDPAEIRLERRALGAETEVEHAHNDWLQGWCDVGWAGGLAWFAFLAWTAWNALKALRDFECERAGLGLVAVGLLVNASVRAPLLWNAASASVFFFAAGALAGRAHGEPEAKRTVLFPWLALALLAAHGREAVSILRLGRELDRAKPAIEVQKALERRDDSVVARTLAARELEARGANAAARDAWRAVLERRPFHVEALAQIGWNSLVLGERAEARRAWERALAIDPTQPAALRNLYALALRSSERDELSSALDAARRSLTNAELVDLAVNGTLAGRELAFVALQTLVPDLATQDGLALEELGKSLAASGQTKLADALECRMDQTSARDFAAQGAWHDAVRLYRQALRLSKKHGEDAGSPLRLEFACALARDGQGDDAKQELAGTRWTPDELALLPEWAGAALVEFGLLAR